MNLDYSIPAGWTFPLFESLSAPIKGAIKIGPFGSALKKNEFSQDGIRVLGIDHVKPVGLVWELPKYIPESKYAELTQYTVSDNDVLVTNMGTVGKACIVPVGFPKAIISSHLIKVTLDQDRCYPEYIALVLNHCPIVVAQIKAKCHGAIMAGFNSSLLKSIQIPLPPLPEQKRIAAILDKADSIRRKRQEAVRLTEELLRSVFLDMFGDPVTNPKGWETKSLSEEIEFLTSGSRGWAEFYSDSGRKFIRIQNVKNGLLNFNEVQYVNPPDNKEAARTKVQENDLLISITADLGRTAVVDKNTAIEGAHINQHLALVRLSKTFNPHFVAAYLESEGGKRQFLQLDQSAVKSGLNFESIKSLQLFAPPLHVQNQYAVFVNALERAKGKLKTASEVIDTLFNSLLQRAFNGEL